LLAVGRLAPVKRFELVIDAAIEARARVPELTLSIIGEGPVRDELQARIDAARATDWIRLVGRLDRHELVAEYRRAWLIVSGSLAEGWGLSLTEGAACGTPCVATDIRGHRSSVVDGVTGVLVEPEGLAGAIADVLTDHSRREALAAAALARARTLTWESSALGITSCLHAAVVGHR
jgi:glycosyltransferase involved in cell wall biosynthesis